MHGVNLAHPKPGERALVYGGGVIGLCTLVALKSKGVEEVIVSDIKENRLAMIKELGGIPFDARTGNVIDFVKEKYGTLVGNMGEETIDVDLVIDAAGYNGVMEEFLANAKTLSRYVIVALNASNVPIVPLYVLAKELTILGSRGYTAQDIKEVIESLRSQENHLDKIITDVYPIEKVQEAFNKAIDAENAIKVVLAYE
jgi:L-iditol 2-dehydrogenase